MRSFAYSVLFLLVILSESYSQESSKLQLTDIFNLFWMDFLLQKVMLKETMEQTSLVPEFLSMIVKIH